MSVKLLSELHLEFVSIKGGCKDLSETTLVQMPHCWKSHVAAHITFALKSRVVTQVSGLIQARLGKIQGLLKTI